ncbi:MAG: type II toxin-antitoxin system RelB/DinJ family antitoxin [Candidatus Saccharibacteria bacterium]|nr:type II toxin-antitoxin system RelB/DinJ family antitoxin [Candidatus Saccharibacteria bacterium]
MNTIARTANINVRVEPEAKEGAEKVLKSLGLSMSDAVNTFCKQIVYRQGIPFELEIPAGPESLDATHWTKERLMAEIQKGIDSAENEPLYDADEVMDEMERMLTDAKV